jgi:hypothetical protein
MSPYSSLLQPGFQPLSQFLSEEFIGILEDIHAFQCVRDFSPVGVDDTISMTRIDNHQASIQSRLIALPSTSSILICCQCAAYLCSVMLRCKIRFASPIPVSALSEQSSNLNLHLPHMFLFCICT